MLVFVILILAAAAAGYIFARSTPWLLAMSDDGLNCSDDFNPQSEADAKALRDSLAMKRRGR